MLLRGNTYVHVFTRNETIMAKHSLPWTFDELGKGLNKSLEVDFECHASPGSTGSYWEPPEPPEIEFADVEIIALADNDRAITVGPSWMEHLRTIAFDLAELHRESLEESLLERIQDYEEAALEDYYDRKRDEQRGG